MSRFTQPAESLVDAIKAAREKEKGKAEAKPSSPTEVARTHQKAVIESWKDYPK